MKKACKTMPIACIKEGYDGYGEHAPIETVWSKHVCERIRYAGCSSYQIPGTSTSNGMPDKLLHFDYGLVYVEFKGVKTTVKGNQVKIACELNAKSLLTRGELCCLIYRAPGILGVLNKHGEETRQVKVDALKRPGTFMQEIRDLAFGAVVKGTTNEQVKMLLDDVSMIGTTRVQDFDLRYYAPTGSESTTVKAYSNGLALKQTYGVTVASAYAISGGWPAHYISYETVRT